MRRAGRITFAALTLFTLLFIIGCRAKPLPESAANHPGQSTGTTLNQPEAVEITSPDELERIWSEYIFDGITTVNNSEFGNPAEIDDRFFLIRYALQRLVKDGEPTLGLSGSTTHQTIPLPTTEQVQAKIREYFNLDLQFDLVAELGRGFAIEPGDKTITVYCEQMSHDTTNPWGIVLKKITYDKTRQEYRVQLDSIANHQTGRVGRITYITLKERADQSLYYQSVNYEYPPTRLVAISGAYTALNPVDFGTEIQLYNMPIQVYGSSLKGDLLLRAQRPSGPDSPNQESVITFSVYDPITNQVKHSLELPQTKSNWLHSIRILPDKLVIKQGDSFLVTGLNLKQIGSAVPLPKIVKDAMANPEFYGGYDVSADLKRIVFTNQTGLYLYDRETGETKKLAAPLPVISDLIETAYILAPQYSAQDTAVIAKLSGYEGYYGVLTVNLNSPELPSFERNLFLLDSLDYTNIMYPIPNMQFAEASSTASEPASRTFGLQMIDLVALSNPLGQVARETVAVNFSDPDNQEPLSDLGNVPLYNGKYLAYVAAKYQDGQQPEDTVYHIVRVNLETRQAETVLTVKAGAPYLRAITEDGRIMLSYHFEREAGLIITDK